MKRRKPKNRSWSLLPSLRSRWHAVRSRDDMIVRKAVPIVLRGDGDSTDILVFEHPRAGTQLVKGTIERGESSSDAAVRELWEESGIVAERIVRDLGVWPSPKGPVWHFHEVFVETVLPERWEHFTQDGGGKLFRFRWHRLAEEPSVTWHPIHRDALVFVRTALREAMRT